MNKNKIVAPQSPLRSSWKAEAFTPAKKRGIVVVNRSKLTPNQGILVKVQGSYVSRFEKNSYGY